MSERSVIPELNLFVIRSTDIQKSVGFYSLLGLVFVQEKHGSGPMHYASTLGATTFEIYPLGKRSPTSDVRLGFTVNSVDEALEAIEPSTIISSPTQTERGRLAVVRDPDGHTIELIETQQQVV